MDKYARRIILSIPYDGTNVRTWEPEDEPVLRDYPDPTGLYLKFSEEPSSYAGAPDSLRFRDTVRYFHYGRYDYGNYGEENYAGYNCGYPVFVNADDFLAYFGFDCTLELSDSADGLVWSLAWNGTETEEAA